MGFIFDFEIYILLTISEKMIFWAGKLFYNFKIKNRRKIKKRRSRKEGAECCVCGWRSERLVFGFW